MGFGFQQARAAGAPYQPPSTPKKMVLRLKERAAEKEIRTLVERNPSIGPIVRNLVEEHRAKCSVQGILFFVQCVLADQSKTGFTVTGHDGKSYKSNQVESIYLDC